MVIGARIGRITGGLGQADASPWAKSKESANSGRIYAGTGTKIWREKGPEAGKRLQNRGRNRVKGKRARARGPVGWPGEPGLAANHRKSPVKVDPLRVFQANHRKCGRKGHQGRFRLHSFHGHFGGFWCDAFHGCHRFQRHSGGQLLSGGVAGSSSIAERARAAVGTCSSTIAE